MSQMPEIKTEVNTEPEKKKKGGFLARLFGGGSSGGSGLGALGGAGGAGAGAGGGLGGLAGGGLLATKAGLLAVVLTGTTVAGGIGLVGYRLFGPGGSDTNGGDGSNLQLFAPKPKADQNAEGVAKDGTSQSLTMLSGANTTPKAADAAASAASKDAAAASATSAASGTGAATGPINKAGDTGNGVNKGLKNAAKFGALTAPGGGGGGGASANSAVKAPVVDASKGVLSSMKKGSGASVTGGSAHALASRKGFGAANQAFGALAANKGAQSSTAAGAVYDGEATSGSNIGGGTPIGGAGKETGAAGPAQPQSINGPADSNTSSAPPTPTWAPACPWQDQITKAQMLIGVAVALLLVAKLLGHTGYGLIATKIIGGIVALIGVLVIAVGAQISGGPYGQKLQGGLLAAAGVGLTIAGVSAGMASSDADATSSSSSAPAPTQTTSALGSGSSGGSGGGMLGGIDPFILLGGGLALAGLAGTMLKPPVTYPAQDANDPNWPKGGLLGYQMQQQFPSEQALKKMIA